MNSTNLGFVTDRDIRLFSFLHSVKAATSEQINREIYSYKNVNVMGDRLRKMEKTKLIIGCGVSHNGISRKYYCLASRGFNRFIHCDDIVREELKTNSPSHDIDLVDIRRRLLDSKIASEYLCENELQTWSEYLTDIHLAPYRLARCDGVAKMNFGGPVWIGIEYEATYKNRSRYKDILKRFYKNSGIPYVIYICKNQELLGSIRSQDKKHYGEYKPKIMYITLNDLMNSDVVCFTSREGKRISLS